MSLFILFQGNKETEEEANKINNYVFKGLGEPKTWQKKKLLCKGRH